MRRSQPQSLPDWLCGELVPQLVRFRRPCDDAAGVVSLERVAHCLLRARNDESAENSSHLEFQDMDVPQRWV